MKKQILRIHIILYCSLLLGAILICGNGEVYGQCAMCRATVENNVSNGDVSGARELNTGILYLFLTPYLLISVIAILWYKNRKAKAGDMTVKFHHRN